MGKGPEETIFPRYTDSQQAHEKVLNITKRQGNANQNHNEIHRTAVRMPIIKKATGNKNWWRCGEKRAPVHVMEMQVGTATMENSIKVPQKI